MALAPESRLRQRSLCVVEDCLENIYYVMEGDESIDMLETEEISLNAYGSVVEADQNVERSVQTESPLAGYRCFFPPGLTFE